ncbi:SDR family NAD(P)-dependent oxidoreductase [Variovorax sp. KK3]|uniref:SDR family NAD(P)-dependent oxidoreductase n=1 Tax=Variovorax sp. KK3 TaxID=1855728 RepID=UPI00097BBED8|nr:SDR family NAD(P)-dependent oxidoreductase [Variovorax sp. KK3]
MKLQGKKAIVTGGARGLGRAYALRLATLGADVAIIDLDLEGAARYGETLDAPSVAGEIERLGRRGMEIQADLSSNARAREAVEAIASAFGGIDILVNNAGGAVTPSDRSDASVMPEEDLRTLLDANFMSTVFCCQAVAPIMKKQGSGTIVNTSSQAGVTTYNHQGRIAGYAAAKAAVAQYTRYLAAELGPHSIRVNCLAPGVMLTARVAAQAAARGIGTEAEMQRLPLRRFGQVEDCAGVVEFLTTDLSQYVTGQVISVCGGAVLTPS